ncbi:MAG: outer membrane protein assembly factor BamE [Hydrogenophaga sp.]|jgi:outer membrane protein assembly factor BamE|uniref:outer membrane protein assembly factor BamE n=1 Tax=Hydrogenophaga sp. TaxID=1904254 RepID=UPI00262C75E3|nr:outer membrane protein assembly factor BamE [Hydrogenophaga sp.]MCW5670280.1 outer membrane protein assembly factor BamE [Hydrogenophaga sp.]
MHFLSPRRARSTKPTLRLAPVLCVLVAVASLSACSYVPTIITPYKIDIVQGNVVTREQANALKPGMSRSEVRDILGSPLLSSVFHADRWDYVFTFRRQGQEPQQRKLTVFFKGETLERFEGDELPSEVEFVASLDARRKFGKVPPLQATEAQLKSFQEKNTPLAPEPTPPAPSPDTVYPPLERSGVAR